MSTEPSVAADESLIIVGIGASAGGVEALSHLFRSIPPDVHAAFLVVTHLGPHRESQLSEILQRVTDLAVEDAIDGVQMQPRTVYVLPANSILTVEPERLSLRTVTVDQRERNPIDICFASLARVYGDNSIGIILSGVGHDGTLGIKAIKEEGGLTIVQAHDLDGPQHGGMAASAVGSGYVDLQLAVHDIGVKVDEYIRSSGALGILAAESDRRQVQEDRTLALKEIYEALRRRVGHDFEGYKEKTFLRRIQRRMQVVQQPSITAYTDYLRQNGEEASYLFRDLLIGVTSFFRDTEAFAALATHVIPRLFEHTTKQDTVRVWVPGCSTGEEAYSLSILMREHMVKLDEMPKVQIFATDIDDAALSAARAGRYPAALLDGMSPQRLQRFFRKEPGSYIVNKELRDLCVFSSHSVIRDPPFSRMDFVSCRNLLIYFNADLQNSVLPVIHYALKPHGFLFLGPSENVSRHSDLFAVVDKKHRIFQRRAAVNANARIPVWAARIKGPGKGYAGHDLMHKDQRMRQVIEDRVLEGFAPAHIVIDGEGDILFYSARTGKYLEPQMGTPSRQLLSMARRGLRLELRSTLREAVEKRQTIVRERLEVDVDDRIQAIRLTIEPLPDSTPEPLFLVVFTDLGPPISREEAASLRPYSVGDDDVSHLEDELKETRDRLQATIEEYETALEELKSGNEELVSVNEELQSTNEEMETSKEELQSVNEELHTVNTELNDRVEELHRANADMHNLLESTQIATVFLDRNMVIRSYTPSVTSIFSLIATDRGRPITDVAHNLQDIDLRQYVRRVLDERASLERTVQQRDSNVYYLMRVLPYRTADDHIDGALVTFVNVTAVVAAEEQQRLLVAELNHRVRNMLQVVMGLANQSLHRSDDLQQFTKVFFGRMQALSRAYELLSRDGWHKVPVGELLRSQLMPFATEGNRYSTEGENLVLRANAALALGMVIYELSTNATKYGALSVSAGRVRITWALEKSSDGQLNFVLRWQESGGPEVKEPTRHGFGSELVHRQLKYELNGTATMNFAEEGLEATLVMPADEAIDLSERRLSG